MGQKTGKEFVGHDLGQVSKKDIVLGVSNSSRDSKEETDQVFRKFEGVSVSQLVVLLSDLKVFDICWKSDMVGCKLAGAFFEDIRFNFLIQALEGSNRCDI